MTIRLDCTEIEIYMPITHYDVVNIKNLRIMYNNNLHSLMWYELTDH